MLESSVSPLVGCVPLSPMDIYTPPPAKSAPWALWPAARRSHLENPSEPTPHPVFCSPYAFIFRAFPLSYAFRHILTHIPDTLSQKLFLRPLPVILTSYGTCAESLWECELSR